MAEAVPEAGTTQRPVVEAVETVSIRRRLMNGRMSSGQSSYNWFNSKLKEAGNIWNSWTKGMEKTVKHFCTTANRIKKGTNEFLKNIDWKNLSGLAGIFNTIGTKTWGKANQ